MQYNHGFNESGGLFRYIVIFVLTAIAGFFLYFILFVLTAIAVYFVKKNKLEEFVSPYGRSNLIYLNAASKEWHVNRRKN